LRTDHVFYRLFKNYPEALFDLLGETPPGRYSLTAVEVKELSFRIDGVLVPEDDNGPIYFLEVQFYDDPEFYLRLFSEIFLYLRQMYREGDKSQGLRDVRIVMLFPERQDTEQLWTSLHRDLFTLPSVVRIYLDELEETENIYTELMRLIVASPLEAPQQAQRLMSLGTSGSVLDLLESIMVNKFPQLSRDEVQQMLGLTDTALKETQFYKDVFEEGFGEGFGEGEEAKAIKVGLKMLRAGMSLEQTAEFTELSIETLRAAQQKGI
jgi:predicted transposase/invertase (TIGR01784 family)